MIFVSVLTPAGLREERCLDRLMEIWLNGNLEAHSFIPGTYWEDNVPAVREQIAQAEIFVCESDGEMGEVRAGEREILALPAWPAIIWPGFSWTGSTVPVALESSS